MIKRIRLDNFRSFDSAVIEFADFNVVIGANAAGKSNLIDALRFVRDIERHGLANAVSMQGGVEYLRNATIGATRPMQIEVTSTGRFVLGPFVQPDSPNDYVRLAAKEVCLFFELTFPVHAPSYKVTKETLTAEVQIQYFPMGHPPRKQESHAGEGTVTVSREANKPRFQLIEATSPGKPIDLDPRYFYPVKTFGNDLMWHLLSRYLYNIPSFADIGIFDIDPKLPKHAVQITGRQQLEEDGSNLALVLQGILTNRGQKQRLTRLMRDLLPFVDRFTVQSIADRSVYFSLHDRYGSVRSGFPAAFMSDGTINVLALICAAFFTPGFGLVVIEEPERNLHPGLIARLIELLREASQKRQILLTTHSPEVLKYSGLSAALLARRNKSGFTEFISPASPATAKFLSEDIGIDELFVRDLLGR